MSVGVRTLPAPARVATPAVTTGVNIPGSNGRTKGAAPGIALYSAGGITSAR